MPKSTVSLNTLLKVVIIVSSPALTVMALYVIFGALNLGHFLYAYLTILILSAVYLYPFLGNVSSLTSYVNDLALDKKVEPLDLGVLSAMTELIQALRNLHYSWEKKKQQMENIITEREILVDSLPDILVMTNDKQEIVRTNRAARNLFGQNLAGKRLSEVIPSDMLLNGVASVVEELQPREIEFSIDMPEPRDFRAYIDRFPSASPEGISLILSFNDITALKRVQKMRADFVANASHEIRTPLASIAGFVETLRGPAKDDPKAREEFLKIMAEQSLRMTALVTDLLSLSKIEMNAHTMPSSPVDLARIIRGEKENFQFQAKEKDVTIRLNANENLPAVRGDENELRQVVHNLLSNAIKYGNSGTEVGITVRVTSALPSDPSFVNRDRAVMIAVTDQGDGIAREHLPRLTERFYRVDSARTRTVGGTGLGLAIVKHIIHRHRGVLTIDSEVGVGSTFSVYLPIFDER